MTHPESPSPWSRVAALGVALAAAVALILLAFAWPGVTAAPRGLPLVVAGEAAQVAQVEAALDERAKGVFALERVDDRGTAVESIEARSAYGGIVLGPSPEVLTASAASPAVAQQVAGFAAALQAQAQAGVAAQAPPGVTPPTVTVEVTDVVPLVDADPRGTGLVAAMFPLVLGGVLGGVAMSLAVAGTGRRLVALAVYAVAGGGAIAGILQGWFGVLPGDYLLNATVFATALLAIGAPLVGLATLAGRVGLGLGAALFLLGANPISAAATPVEFLPAPWGAIGQWLPPGAGATLLRDAAYFPAADATFPWLVLGGWAIGGLLLVLAGLLRRTRATEPTFADAAPAPA